MRILADEGMDRGVVDGLRTYGHDVRWVVETNPSEEDIDLLKLGRQDQRTVITYDKDFGELICRHNVPAPYGVILFRIHGDVPKDVKTQFIVSATTSWDSWDSQLSGVWTVQIRHSSKAA